MVVAELRGLVVQQQIETGMNSPELLGVFLALFGRTDFWNGGFCSLGARNARNYFFLLFSLSLPFPVPSLSLGERNVTVTLFVTVVVTYLVTLFAFDIVTVFVTFVVTAHVGAIVDEVMGGQR